MQRRLAHMTCCALLCLAGCLGSPSRGSEQTGAPDAGDAEGDGHFVLVDVGPRRPVTATITTPPDDMVVSQNSNPQANLVPLDIDVEGQTPDAVHLVVNGSPEDALVPPYHYEWDLSGRPQGEYELSAWSIIGNRAYAGPPRIIEIDNEGGFSNISPIIEFPASRRSVDESLQVTVRARGLVSPADYELFADGTKVQTDHTSSLAVFDLRTRDWEVGPVALQARVGISGESFWTVPRTVDVQHTSSTRFEPLGAPIESWRDIELEVDSRGTPYAALTNTNAIEVHTFSDESGEWRRLGDPLTQQWQPGLPDIEVASDGTLYAAWSQRDATEPWNNLRNVHAARWDAEQQMWIRMGEAVERTVQDDATSALLWLDGDDVPHVALARRAGGTTDGIEVARWNAETETWRALGSRISAPARAGTIALGHEDDGPLLMVWRANFQVFVHRYSPSFDRWLPSTKPALDGFATDAAWPDGRLTVPIFGRSGFSVVESDGTSWRELDAGAVPRPASIGSVGDLTLDGNGNPVLAWLKYVDARDLYAGRWIDGTWEPLATAPVEPDIDSDVQSTAVASGGGRLLFGFASQNRDGVRVEIREFNE